MLREHIEIHRYFMGLDQKRDISMEEAVSHWYEQVYLPVVRVIREQGILRDFPERTETDLYLWISEHRAALENAFGWEVETDVAAADLAAQFSPKPQRVVARVSEKIRDAIVPDELENGAPPGSWREEHVASREEEHLFAGVLVPVSGEEIGWHALDQALEVAHREKARLRGLHIVPTAAEVESDEAQAVKAEFDRRCEAAGIQGRLTLEVGKVSRKICEWARWADLVVVNLAHPPGPQPVARLGSGFRTMLRCCSRPVLAVPRTFSPLSRALLAYDDSPKAKEALFVATYLAARWQIPLVVVSVLENRRVTSEALDQAQQYLEAKGVETMLLQQKGAVAEEILKVAEAQACDLILMGGYGHSPVLEVVLGSVVDEVLRESRMPVLICR
jgi:nucleotide-binding universal stress UspA family protein